MNIRKYIFALVAVVLLATLAGCGAAGDPLPCADDFLAAYAVGDSSAAAELVVGYSTFDIDGASDSEYHSLMTQLLRDNFSYTVLSAQTAGSSAQVEADITFFDFRKLAEPLEEAISEEAMTRKGLGEELDSEEAVISMLCDVVRTMTEDPSPYLSTERAVIDLRASGNEWRVVPSDALLEILMGYAG